MFTRASKNKTMCAAKKPTFDTTPAEPLHPSRWSLFSLMCAGSVLWIHLQTRRHQAAIREIERLGGVVETRNTAPAWLQRWLGDGPMRILVEACSVGVIDSDMPLRDADLKHLAELTALEVVVIDNADVTDAAVVYIERLTRLDTLYLWGTHWTDDALVHLRHLTRLKEIDIESPQITDAGIQHLQSLPHLSRLILRKVKVTQAGVDELKRIHPNLDILVLSADYGPNLEQH